MSVILSGASTTMGSTPSRDPRGGSGSTAKPLPTPTTTRPSSNPRRRWHLFPMVHGVPVNQHTVSEVVLRKFGSRSSKAHLKGRLAILDRQSAGRTHLKHPRSIFTISRFVEHDAAGIEQLWGSVESRLGKAFPCIDEWPLDPRAEDVLRDVIAVHWVRSASVFDLHERLSAEAVAASKARLASRAPDWTRIFEERTGLQPVGEGALQWIMDETYKELAAPVIAEQFSAKVQEYFDKARLLFQRYRIQVARAPRANFLIGDAPVITPNAQIQGLGPHQGVARSWMQRISSCRSAQES